MNILKKLKNIKNQLKNIKDQYDLKPALKQAINKEIEKINEERGGQGAAEYILLFGGVIVIAIAALLIYRSYFEGGQSGLNASEDVNNVREIMNST